MLKFVEITRKYRSHFYKCKHIAMSGCQNLSEVNV